MFGMQVSMRINSIFVYFMNISLKIHEYLLDIDIRVFILILIILVLFALLIADRVN